MRLRDRLKRALTRRSPWVAALLNMMPGLGYLYAGRKKLLGVSLLTMIWTLIILAGMYKSGKIPVPFVYWAIIGAPLFMFFAFARDAYLETKKRNEER